MVSDFVLYGSTGYIGRAVARLAVDHGLQPLLVGRNTERVSSQAAELETVMLAAAAKLGAAVLCKRSSTVPTG